jgi:queuosine precursor transporter
MNVFLLLLAVLFSFVTVLVAFRLGHLYLFAYLSAYIGFALSGLVLFVDFFGYPLAFMEIAYGVWFLTTDILSEHYGPKKARQLVFSTTFLLFVFFCLSQLIIYLEPHHSDTALMHLIPLFQPLTRIIGAGAVVFLLEQLMDIWIFHAIRRRTGGRNLWMRNCCSTLTVQLFDVLVFYPLAFAGVVPELWKLMVAAYAFKAGVAILDTPFMYLSYRFRPAEVT